MVSVSSKNSSSEVTKPEETTKAQETTKATEAATKETQAPTKATEATTKATQAPTKATEASSVSTKGEKLILNANDVSTGKIKSSTVVDGLKIVATSKKTVTVDKSDKDYKNISFTLDSPAVLNAIALADLLPAPLSLILFVKLIFL